MGPNNPRQLCGKTQSLSPPKKKQKLKKFIKGSLLKKVFTRVADFQAASLKTN